VPRPRELPRDGCRRSPTDRACLSRASASASTESHFDRCAPHDSQSRGCGELENVMEYSLEASL
jgi:hypothetical protein